ncbi:MAG: alpha/beta fold hydrolase [Brevundimonas sp.]|uniref:alpha/beta hydrolase family protein n=1 Tax=Brevundimonas sp. TaxID=1871086 RepID=UPI003002C8A6
MRGWKLGRAIAIIIAVLVAPSTADAQQGPGLLPLTPPISAEASAFGSAPAFHNIAVSPDGERIARITQREDRYRIEVWDVDDLSAPTAGYTLSRYNIANWLVWKSDDRLIVSTSEPGDRFGFLMFETRLSAFDADLKNRVKLADPGRRRTTAYPAFQDQLIDLLPGDPDGILIAFNWTTPHEPAVQRADLTTGRLSVVRNGGRDIKRWLFDPATGVFVGIGNVAAVPSVSRSTGGSDLESVPLPGVGSTFQPLALDGSPDRLVVASNHEPGPVGIYVYDLAQGAFVDTLFKSPHFDADGIVPSADGRRVDGVVWVDHRRRVFWLNDAARAEHARLQALTGEDELVVVSRSPDGRHALVVTGDGGRQVGSFLVDLVSDTVKPLWRMSPALDAYAAASTSPVTYGAPDGVEIPAYLTLPADVEREAARGLPFIVMPHGGPSARDSEEFDFLAQFLASLGYGVLQPNYRGSSGYGEAFRRAGDRQWSEAVLQDVSAGAQWLVSEGLADPERVCVVGWSFGGYLALMSAVEEGELYNCAAAIAPVTDIPQIIDYSRLFRGGRDAMARMFGVGWGDHGRNVRASPINRVREMRIPVFMAYGTGDDVVPVAQGFEMYRAMRGAGVNMWVLEVPGADHSMTRQPDRTLLLASLEGFLATHLGSRSQPPR